MCSATCRRPQPPPSHKPTHRNPPIPPTPTPRVRHEAGEALGAIGRPECLAALRRHAADAAPEVAETCQLALERIEHLQRHPESAGGGESPYLSVDPTPPLPADTPVERLREILLDPKERMFEVRGCWWVCGWGGG